MIKRIDETLALLGRRGAPGLPEHEPRCVLGIEVRQQHIGHQRIELSGILGVHGTVRIELREHALGGVLYELFRAERVGGGGLGRGGRRGLGLGLRQRFPTGQPGGTEQEAQAESAERFLSQESH